MTKPKQKPEPVAIDPAALPASARKELALGLAVMRLEALTRHGSAIEAESLAQKVMSNTMAWLLGAWELTPVDARIQEAVSEGVTLLPLQDGPATPEAMEGLQWLLTATRPAARPGPNARWYGMLKSEVAELESLPSVPATHPRMRLGLTAAPLRGLMATIEARATEARERLEQERRATARRDTRAAVEQEAASFAAKMKGAANA